MTQLPLFTAPESGVLVQRVPLWLCGHERSCHPVPLCDVGPVRRWEDGDGQNTPYRCQACGKTGESSESFTRRTA